MYGMSHRQTKKILVKTAVSTARGSMVIKKSAPKLIPAQVVQWNVP